MPPTNDDLANAITISGASGSVGPVTIDDATTQGGEIGSVDESIWYKFNAIATATGVYFSTQGSAAGDADSGDGITPPNPFGSLDTKINVYEVNSSTPTFSNLFGHNIASNDDAPTGGGAYWSEVTFNVTSGKWYFIQVGTIDPTYTGTVVLGWSGVPAPAADVPLTIDFISEAHGCQLLSRDAGQAVPVTMPTGVQAGDYLVCSMGQVRLNVVDPSLPPPGWTIIQQDQWYKIADGSESGTTVNWTTQNTHLVNGDFRTWCAAVFCYRFSTPPTAILVGSGAADGTPEALGTSASAPLGDAVDGLTTQLRVYFAAGSGAEQGPGSFANNNDPLTGITWTNVMDRTGLIQLDFYAVGTSDASILDDSQGVSVGDVIHSNPNGAFDPGDAITMFSAGPYSTGGRVGEVVFYWPQLLQVAYWGINASTPT